MPDGARFARDRDQDAVDDLAKHTKVPIDEVRAIYHEELAALAHGARVTTFLPVLAKRRARERLMRRR